MIIRFKDEYSASRYEWLFVHILGMHYVCVGGYYNAFSY